MEKRTGKTIVRYFGPAFERVYEKGLWHDELYVTVGGERLAYVSTAPAVKWELFYLHPDVQGTIGVVTDEGGEVAKYTLYAPFGETYEELTAVKVDLRYGYTGGEHDEEVGLIHLGVREHEPRYARFLQPDPITPDVYDRHRRGSSGGNAGPARVGDCAGRRGAPRHCWYPAQRAMRLAWRILGYDSA